MNENIWKRVDGERKFKLEIIMYTQKSKNKMSSNKAVSEMHQMYGRNWAVTPPRISPFLQKI